MRHCGAVSRTTGTLAMGMAFLLGIGWGGICAPRALAGEDPAARASLQDGHARFRQGLYAQATEAFAKAATEAEAAGDERALVEALAMQARGLLAAERKEEGRQVLARAEERAREDQPLDRTVVLATRGRFQWKDGRNAEATQTFEAMYRIALEHRLFDRAVDAAHMIGLTGTPEQQVAWARKGIEAAEQGGMDGWLGPLWNNLGLTHEQAGRYEEALACYLEARKYHWKVGTETNKLAADWAVGHAHRLAGHGKEAGTWLRPVLAWAERLHAEDPTPENAEWVGSASKELGLLLATSGRGTEALPLLLRARDLLAAAKMEAWDPAGWKELVERIAALESAAVPEKR